MADSSGFIPRICFSVWMCTSCWDRSSLSVVATGFADSGGLYFWGARGEKCQGLACNQFTTRHAASCGTKLCKGMCNQLSLSLSLYIYICMCLCAAQKEWVRSSPNVPHFVSFLYCVTACFGLRVFSLLVVQLLFEQRHQHLSLHNQVLLVICYVLVLSSACNKNLFGSCFFFICIWTIWVYRCLGL